jgi:hypothetical protein
MRSPTIGLLYEHPSWSAALIDRAVERGIDLRPFDVGDPAIDPLAATGIDVWVNRVNAMPSAGRPSTIVAATGHLLLALELRGATVINGSTTHRIGGSKMAQNTLFEQAGLNAPASIAIYRPGDAVAASRRLGFPVLTKPNVGGSGSGIARHDDLDGLQAAADTGAIDLGIDGTGLVQEVIESADGLIHRVEMLGDSLFYATQQVLQPDAFNYCAADGCAIEPGGSAIQLFDPPAEIVAGMQRVMTTAATHVGGAEYIVDVATGEPTFYDFNPYSNFVTGFDDQLGFNPIDRYLDFVVTLA